MLSWLELLISHKPLMLHLVGCLYYLCQWCTVKQISDNEIYLLIKYIKSVLWRVAKRLSYIEDARCLKFKPRERAFKQFKTPFLNVLNRQGAKVQSTTGSRAVRISVSNAGYTMFRGSVKGTGYPLHSPVSPSLPLSCVTVCHHISTGLWYPTHGTKKLTKYGIRRVENKRRKIQDLGLGERVTLC